MDTKVKIINLERYREYGWQWTVIKGDWQANYRTNSNGYGLWVEGRLGNFKQISGTSQFSLVGNKNSVRSKLYRWFKK